MSESLTLPAGQPVVIEFIRETKPDQRGVLPDDFREAPAEQTGIWFDEVRVPDGLGFGQAFRIEVTRKWLNLAAIAELRYLPKDALHGEIARLRELHEQIQKRLHP